MANTMTANNGANGRIKVITGWDNYSTTVEGVDVLKLSDGERNKFFDSIYTKSGLDKNKLYSISDLDALSPFEKALILENKMGLNVNIYTTDKEFLTSFIPYNIDGMVKIDNSLSINNYSTKKCTVRFIKKSSVKSVTEALGSRKDKEKLLVVSNSNDTLAMFAGERAEATGELLKNALGIPYLNAYNLLEAEEEYVSVKDRYLVEDSTFDTVFEAKFEIKMLNCDYDELFVRKDTFYGLAKAEKPLQFDAIVIDSDITLSDLEKAYRLIKEGGTIFFYINNNIYKRLEKLDDIVDIDIRFNNILNGTLSEFYYNVDERKLLNIRRTTFDMLKFFYNSISIEVNNVHLLKSVIFRTQFQGIAFGDVIDLKYEYSKERGIIPTRWDMVDVYISEYTYPDGSPFGTTYERTRIRDLNEGSDYFDCLALLSGFNLLGGVEFDPDVRDASDIGPVYTSASDMLLVEEKGNGFYEIETCDTHRSEIEKLPEKVHNLYKECYIDKTRELNYKDLCVGLRGDSVFLENKFKRIPASNIETRMKEIYDLYLEGFYNKEK